MGFFDSLAAIFGGGAPDPNYYNKLFRLVPGEVIVASSGGHFIEGLGFETVTRGKTYLFVITNHNHLIVGDMVDSSLAQRFPVGSVHISDRGYLDQLGFFGDRAAITGANPQGVLERLRVLSFTPQASAPFAMTVVESLVAQVLQFSGPSQTR
jgi:hypothetical protein